MNKKIIKVAGVAIIDQKNNKVLAAKRETNRILEKMWEFPGGKIEKGETAEQAAQRELEEEFNDEIQIGPQLGWTVSYEYEFGVVELTVFYAKLLTHNFALVAHSEIEWLSTDQLRKLNWAPADQPLVEQLAKVDLEEIEF